MSEKLKKIGMRGNAEVDIFMKNLGKVICNTRVFNTSKQQELQSFLRCYRETPHSSTKIASALILLGRSNAPGLPSVSKPNLALVHAEACKNDAQAKAEMKKHYDQYMNTKQTQIRLGTRVFLKLEKKDKSTLKWDPMPYTVMKAGGFYSF